MGLFQSSPVEPVESFPPLNDSFLVLKDRRKLAFQTCGVSAENETKDTLLVLAFHGALGTGDFKISSPLFESLGWRVISPTIPGWGQSSPQEGRTLADWPHDVAQLLGSLGIDPERKFVALGISYGCVHAIACAAYFGVRLQGLALLGPHGPFDDPNFNPLAGMNFPSAFGLGRVANSLPFLGRMAGDYVRKATSTPTKARDFVQKMVLSKLSPIESEQLALAPAGVRGHLLSGVGMHYSLMESIVGYAEIPQVLRSWKAEDLTKVACPTHIFVGNQDQITPLAGATYLRDKIAGSRLTILEGGHFSLVLLFEKCVSEFAKETLARH